MPDGLRGVSDDFHNHSQRRARKEHRCSECHGGIRSGEIYSVFTGVFEGDFYSIKMCAHCGPAYEAANKESWRVGGEGLEFGSLHEDVFESHDAERMAAYIKNKVARGAEVPAWMHKVLAQHSVAPVASP
jgi:hypothetical protein